MLLKLRESGSPFRLRLTFMNDRYYCLKNFNKNSNKHYAKMLKMRLYR